MRMQAEEGPDAVKPTENGEAVNSEVEAKSDSSICQKYRGLKNKLKYLIYEHRCFESELNRAQNKLVELSRDKTVLLDELLQYEPVSGEEEDMTDASGDEGVPIYRPVPLKQVGEGSKSPHPPASGGASKPSQLTKQGIAKASAIINSVSNNIATKVTKTGTKRQARQPGKAGGGASVKISKIVSRVRQNNSVPGGEEVATATVVEVGNSADSASSLGISNKKLVVSYPINSIAAESTSPTSVGSISTSTFYSHTMPLPPPTTAATHPGHSNKTTTITTTTKAVKRPIPALTKAQAPPPPSSASSLHSSSSALLVSSMGSVHVTTISTASSIPPLIPVQDLPAAVAAAPKGRGNDRQSSSSSSTTSSSSSNSDTGGAESGSDLSSGSDDEAMEIDLHDHHRSRKKGGGGGGPVQLVSTVKSSSNLPRPKAILSPVKITPPLMVRSVPTTTPPGSVMSMTVISPQPAFTTVSPISGGPEGVATTTGLVGFLPTLASPLSSPSTPSSALPFSSLNKPGGSGSGSAFQVFSSKHHATTPPHPAPSPSLHASKPVPGPTTNSSHSAANV